jgi:hypothetical protein
MLKWLLAAVVLYGGFLALLYVAQRSVQYFPERRRTAPRAAGLPEAEEAVLNTAARGTLHFSLFPWQRRFTAMEGGALSIAHRRRQRASGAQLPRLRRLERRRASSRTRRQPMPLPSRAILPSASSDGANRLGLRSRWRWQRKSRSGTWYSGPLSLRPPMSAHSTTGSCRCGSS